MRHSPAADRQRAREAIDRAVARLRHEDRIVVLEDALHAAQQAQRPVRHRGESPSISQTDLPLAPVADAKRSVPLWRAIETYCRNHPSPEYDPAEVAAGLGLPLAPAQARNMVYVTVKRKSPQTDRGTPRDPRFELVGQGKFRLLEKATPPTHERGR